MGSTDTDTLVSSIETKLNNVPLLTSEPSIYRAPVELRDVNNKAYTPKLVSIGPYHRNTLALQPMEIHKLRYLKELLSKPPQKNVKFYVESLRELEVRARQCFAESVDLPSKSNEFLEMLLIDGCFIIEFMLKCCGKVSIDTTDFVFSTEWMPMTLAYDMILMENQLPFFVIEHLYNLIRNQPEYPNDFLTFTLKFLSMYVSVGKFSLIKVISSEHQVKHFVDLIVRCCAPSSLPSRGDQQIRFIPTATELYERLPSGVDQFIPTATELYERLYERLPRGVDQFIPTATELYERLPSGVDQFIPTATELYERLPRGVDQFIPTATELYERLPSGVDQFIPTATELYERLPRGVDQQIRFIPTATELHEAGVKFKKDTSSNSIFLDIKFTKNGVMSIPHLNIHDNTELIFRNLVAYEQCENSPKYVSNYTTVMDCLINTPNDVALLRHEGIINSWMGKDEEVSDLFNRVGKGKYTNSDTFYYSELFEEVNSYYKKTWNRWKARLKRDYFNTPWSTMSFVAAVILLICSLVQSIFSVIKP